MILDPDRWTVTASVGYPYFLGSVLGLSRASAI